MTYEWMLPVVALNAMSQQARQRALNPMMLTMMPVAPAMRGPVAAIALSQQAEDSIRQERQVSEQTVRAVEIAARTPGGVSQRHLDGVPALAAVDRAALSRRINATVNTIVGATVQQVAHEAVALVTAVQRDGEGAIDDKVADKYPALAAHYGGKEGLLELFHQMQNQADRSASPPARAALAGEAKAVEPGPDGGAEPDGGAGPDGGAPRSSPAKQAARPRKSGADSSEG
ncbi:hypothetical protein ACPPVO_28560 [Dactylosporangium sp. McL0621]|uniref:hypothetical protein n=1 Tax=Dactylosporangium sp. McL0621 TaxID=3415678 RepID=UPI003CF35191